MRELEKNPEEENRTKRLDEIDTEYVNLVNEAIREDLNLEISNSTLNHAVFLSKKLISLSENNIKILTGELDSPYYEEIKDDLENAAISLSKGNGKISILIWNKIGDGNTNFAQLRERYKDAIEIKCANRTDSINHFLVSDSKRYRFEEVHSNKDLENENIKGKANFNNKEVAEALSRSFDSIWSGVA